MAVVDSGWSGIAGQTSESYSHRINLVVGDVEAVELVVRPLPGDGSGEGAGGGSSSRRRGGGGAARGRRRRAPWAPLLRHGSAGDGEAGDGRGGRRGEAGRPPGGGEEAAAEGGGHMGGGGLHRVGGGGD